KVRSVRSSSASSTSGRTAALRRFARYRFAPMVLVVGNRRTETTDMERHPRWCADPNWGQIASAHVPGVEFATKPRRVFVFFDHVRFSLPDGHPAHQKCCRLF